MLARQHALRRLEQRQEQRQEQVVVATGQFDHHALGIDEVAPQRVEHPAFEHVAPGPDGRLAVARAVGAAQHRIDPGQQFTRVERLGEIVVRADFETDDAIGLVPLGGEHDHRRLRLGTHLAAQFETADAGQHDVENDQVDRRLSQHLAHLVAIAGGADLETVAAQELGDEMADLAIVVDDEDMRAAAGFRRRARSGIAAGKGEVHG